MNNKPVAWMSEHQKFIGFVEDEICHIPLYTHPAELTDEEIKQLAYQHRWNGDVEFARAILRKASDK